MKKILAVLSLIPSVYLSAQSVKVPDGLEWKMFADKDVAACSAALSALPDGSVFVGIDKNGSLGKGEGKGYILKFVDTDNDGKHDKMTKYAPLESVRGLMAVGNKLYALHSTWKEKKFDTCYLSVVEDKDNDGVADGPFKPLVKGMSSPVHNNARGVDHSTNGIRMGIDGWIYIAMGDFGIVNAEGTDGKKLTVLGGGVIRVRPDGTELEEYVHGLRNICDVAIDPYMNMFTRGNTNDGGGWNIRFIHEIQSGEYGYPKLFKRYTNEILPALEDFGGGSGMGSMYFEEPNWPEKYNNVPLMGDWGRSHVYIHRLTPNGASFTQKQEDYITVGKMTDIDVDGSGRMYISSWEGSGYSGGTGGYVVRVVPKGWQYQPFPDLTKASDKDLISYLKKPSATWRFHVSQEIVNANRPVAKELAELINDKSALKQSRIAAMFTLKQLSGADANKVLFEAAKDSEISEWALRAVADRIPQNKGIEIAPFIAALKNNSQPRVQVAAAVALGRIGNKEAAPALIEAAHYENKIESKSNEKNEKVFTGNAAYVSPIIKGDVSVNFDIDVLGWKSLNIVIIAPKGSSSADVAIFDPYFITKDGKKVKLTDLGWITAKTTTAAKLNKNIKGEELKPKNGNLNVTFGIGTKTGDSIQWKLDATIYSRLQGTIALSSSGKGEFVVVIDKNPIKLPKVDDIAEGPHATPNKEIVLPHVAVKSLINLNAIEASLAAIGQDKTSGAYWAMKYMHDEKLIDGLVGKLASATGETKNEILKVLVRFYNREIEYDGSWWWSTRPDTRGPYYKPTTWSASPKISKALVDEWKKTDDSGKEYLASILIYDRVEIKEIPLEKYTGTKTVDKEEPKVDLSKITNQKGQVGKMAVEDIMLALGKIKGDVSKGEAIFTQQGCIVCHSYKNDQVPKGPNMGAVGGVLKREEIIMSILRPNDSISQGFHSYNITMNNGAVHQGFITSELDNVVTVRNIAGIETKLNAKDIKQKQELPTSMMPEKLADGLSLEEFASLVDWLKNNK